MDAFKPLLQNIIRLEVSHKPLFYIAGVQDNKIEKIKLERARAEAQKKQKKDTKDESSDSNEQKTETKSKHLDTWAQLFVTKNKGLLKMFSKFIIKLAMHLGAE